MNVALWAEIRRLTEIEKLSARAIARRLHCSRHTVAATLTMQQPPTHATRRRASLLEPYMPQINDLLAKYPELSAVRIHEEIAHGPTLGCRFPLVRSIRWRSVQPTPEASRGGEPATVASVLAEVRESSSPMSLRSAALTPSRFMFSAGR